MYTYIVCALGYDADDCATDTDIFLGAFHKQEEAIEHAKKFYDIECITGKLDHPDYEVLGLEEGEYLVVRVEKCVKSEDSIECIDVVWQNTIYQEVI